jgi:DNA-binding IclR family transcriptional regulator
MKQGLQKGEKGIAGAQAIRRAMEVVRVVAQSQRTGASLSRVAQATNLNQSTVFRMLRSLTEERLLYYDEDRRSYFLGVLAFELGLAAKGESRVQDFWQPAIEHVAARTRLTTYLMAQSGTEAVCLLCAQGSSIIRAMPMVVGQRLPLGVGAGSLAILATLDDDEIDHALAQQAHRIALFPSAKNSPESIRERVKLARDNGYSLTQGTVATGLTGIGVAIRPKQGILQLSISVSAVVDSINPTESRQIAEILAAEIARNLARPDNPGFFNGNG